jgi:type III secretory pathway component EscV
MIKTAQSLVANALIGVLAMLITMILAASLSGQAPQPMKVQSRPDPAAKKLIAKRKAKKATAYTASIQRAEAERQASLRQAEADQKQYEKMLPYMLENQRQQLAAMAAAERNAALQRMASAMEKQAGYSYPGQMPAPPTTVPSNPLYGPLVSPP